jgi:pimeloyl-ACP methyl ester carboxylesterase
MTTTSPSTPIKKLAISLALFLTLPALAAAARPQQTIDRTKIQKAVEGACHVALCSASNVQRRDLGNSIAEYTFALRVGAGANDVIGLHRVVREEAPFRPARTQRALLMTHGDIWGFDAAFLADPSHALPVYLARNGVDVWGIDLRWIRVPATTTDFTFMKNWGIEQDARDLAVALTVARVTRLATGNGLSRMTLLGWSRGGVVGYAYLNGEAQLPPGLRNVKGFIPVDIYLKTNDEGFRQSGCRRYAATKALIDAGTYQSTNGTTVLTIASLATSNPNGASPVFPGLTNRQAELLTGEATFVFFPPDQQPVPSYHFTGGTFAPTPLPSGLPVPTGLVYSPEPTWLAVLRGASPFQPLRESLDSDAAICGTPDVHFDDHLAQITVPVLYVGAGGGFGEYGVYTTTLLGSTDVTTRIVDLSADRLADFGHADIFIGTNAQSLVWQPILNWLRTH